MDGSNPDKMAYGISFLDRETPILRMLEQERLKEKRLKEQQPSADSKRAVDENEQLGTMEEEEVKEANSNRTSESSGIDERDCFFGELDFDEESEEEYSNLSGRISPNNISRVTDLQGRGSTQTLK